MLILDTFFIFVNMDRIFISFFLFVFSLILDNERWKQADVPAEFQELVDHITKSGNKQILIYQYKMIAPGKYSGLKK